MYGTLCYNVPYNRKDNMYHVLHKIADEYFCVSKLRKPIATLEEAKEKIRALKTLDANEKYIITQVLDNE